jgi:PAS domain S-box-containing protein
MSKSIKNPQKPKVLRDLAIIFIVALFAFFLATVLDMRERFDIWAHQFGKSVVQFDEIAILFAILMLAFNIFSLRRWRELAIEINGHEHTKDEILRRSRELSVLYKIDRAASQSLNLDKVLNDALEATLEGLGIEAGGIYFLEPGGEILTLRVHHGVSDEFVKNMQYLKLGEGACGRAVAEKRPVILYRTKCPPEGLAAFVVAKGLQTFASTPLLVSGEPVGAMNLVMGQPRTFSPEELELLTAIGQQLGIATQNARLYETAQQELADRKRAEEALQDEREKLETVTQNIGAGLAIISKDYRTLWANKVLKDLFGDVEGKTCYSTYNQRAEICLGCGVREVFERGAEIIPHEQVGKDVDGNTIWSEIIATPVKDKDGNITAALELVIPITERKKAEKALRESEERYRLLAENATDVIWTADMGLNVTYVSPSVYRTRGYTPEEIMAMELTEQLTPDSIAFANQVLSEELAVEAREDKDLKRSRKLELEFTRKDGSTYWSEVNLTFIRDPEGKAVGLLGVSRDIAERKRAEREMMALQEQLRQSQKMEAIGRLAGGIAHDFNNLLTIIKGYSQLSLVDLKEDDPLRTNIEGIKNAADRAADLTRQLLAFGRRQIMEMKVLDLNTILRNLEKMLRRLIGEDIELTISSGDDLGRVKVDPGQIEQVIMNLAVNARDAMLRGGKLTIEIANMVLDEEYACKHVAVKPGHYVMLSVSDTGIGMTPEVRERVFEPFFTTKEKGKGTGLGLSTVYGIVKQSGGNIWVYSEFGRGTTFKIYLPQVDEPLERLGRRVEVNEIPRGTETILLVEDEEEVRNLAMRFLESRGYKVLEASQGLEAFLIAEEYEGIIHLLMTDVVMPKLSGRELADRIAEIRPEIKVLFMSGYADHAIVHHGVLEEGMNYLQKPFTLDGLAKKVREVLNK